jgi:hypothetical protein
LTKMWFRIVSSICSLISVVNQVISPLIRKDLNGIKVIKKKISLNAFVVIAIVSKMPEKIIEYGISSKKIL